MKEMSELKSYGESLVSQGAVKPTEPKLLDTAHSEMNIQLGRTENLLTELTTTLNNLTVMPDRRPMEVEQALDNKFIDSYRWQINLLTAHNDHLSETLTALKQFV